MPATTDVRHGIGYRCARVLTEALSPAVVVFVLPFAVAWPATGHHPGRTAWWGSVTAVSFGVLPTLMLVVGARQGRWDGHWVRERGHRFVPFLLCLASASAGLAILTLGNAPADVRALGWAMVTTLVTCLVITRWWKVSVHAAVAGGAVALLVLLYGRWLALLVVAVVAVCWSRVRLTEHTAAQVAVGALLGPVIGGAVFLLVR